MGTKQCEECGEAKILACFYKHPLYSDGLMHICKECHKARMRKRQRDNDSVREYDRERAKLPHRKQRSIEYMKVYRAQNPEKYKATNAVNNAIRDGKLKKKPCQICGNTKVHAHHHDYSKPLDVEWYCALHHHRGHHQGFDK